MTDAIDSPSAVRRGEELDEAALTEHLVAAIDGFEAPIEVKQFPSGYSNLTYLLKSADSREFVLRRPPVGANIKSGHDMSREWRVLSALDGVFDKSPHPYLHLEDESVIGAPFYLMERVRGIILRGANPDVQTLDEQAMRSACEALVDTLVEIHGVDIDEVGLGEFGRPQGYVERQIEGWTRRWHRAKTDDIPALDRSAKWLADNMPDDLPGVLIHNDFKYDNVVYSPDDFARIEAVLDWEMATVGDPLMDLGTSLAYWVENEDDSIIQTVAGPTARPGNLTRNEVVTRYAHQSGRDVSDIAFYYVYGLFKVAIIGQQIYHRFKQGHTKDPRFGGLIHLVRAIGERADTTLETGEF